MICCLILVTSCLVIPVWADVDVTGKGTFQDADAQSVIAATFIALGVSPGEASTDFDALVTNCMTSLTADGFVSDGKVSMYVYQYSDTKVQCLISSDFVAAVRSWLFANACSTQISVSGFSSSAVANCSAAKSWHGLNKLGEDNASNLLNLLYSLGINDKVLITGICESSPYALEGYYFASDGRLFVAQFDNPLGQVSSSLFGVYDLISLDFYSGSSAKAVSPYIDGYTSSSIYYSQYYAEASGSFATGNCVAFNWSKDPFWGTYGNSHAMNFYFFVKPSSDTTWRSYGASGGLYSTFVDYNGGYCPSAGSISWGASSSVTSSYNLTLGDFASSDVSMEEGYPAWAVAPYSVDGVSYYGLTIHDTYEETITQGQTTSQSGYFDISDDSESGSDGSETEDTTTSPSPAAPVFSENLSTETVNYDLGDEADSLTVSAYSTDGGFIAYQWYVKSSITDAQGSPIDGATSNTYTPPTDVGGTLYYACAASNFLNNRVTTTFSLFTPVYVYDPDAPASDSSGSGSDTGSEDGTTSELGQIKNSLTVVQNKLDAVSDSVAVVDDKVDEVLSGGEAGSDLTDTSGEFSDTAGEIDEFEQSQMDVLDENMEELKKKVDFVDFVPALAFVQKYINLAFDGAKDFSVIFYLPLFLGLFFYICSRVPGVTRFSRPSAPVKKEG